MSDLSDRGLRNPRHTFGVSHPSDRLFPLFVAPLRPMETLVGLRFRARSMLNRMCQVNVSPPSEVEYCVWVVPVRSIGNFFTDMFTVDMEDQDNMETGATSAGLPRVAGLPINTQGHASRVPLQNRDRLWAGESGQADGELTVDFRASYAPYVSHALWHIARSWYETEINEQMLSDSRTQGWLSTARAASDASLYQEPPTIGRLIRSATNSGQAFGAGADLPSTVSMSEFAMRMSVLDNVNQSWPEFLKAQGVDPRRIDGLPRPVIMQRRLVEPFGSPIAAFAAAPTGAATAALSNDRRGGWYAGQDSATATGMGAAAGALYGNFGGYGLMGTRLDVTRGRRLMIDEPSLLVGTLAWRVFDFDQRSQAQIFDATFMVNAGTWGVDRLGGSVDERDFIINRNLDRSGEDPQGRPEGSSTAALSDRGSILQPGVFNMLNLFINGDTYCNVPNEIGKFRRPLSDIIEGTDESFATTNHDLHDPINTRLVTYGDVRFGVATDLVPK